MCLRGGLFYSDTRRIPGSQSFPSLSTPDTAHSLPRLCHLLVEVFCCCSPVPDLCPASGRRPFSLPCLHCSPPSQVTCQHLLSTSAALHPLISSSISGFWCPFMIHLLFFFLAQTFFRASKTVFFFHSWSNCIAVKLCNRFSTFC